MFVSVPDPHLFEILIPTRKTVFHSLLFVGWLFGGWRQQSMHLGGALANRLEDGLVLNVIGVVGLELGGDTIEGALQGLLGRSVNHLRLLY